MTNAVSITVYLPDDSELPCILALLERYGFKETDWCEMTMEGSEAHVSYGPRESLPPRSAP